MSGWCHRTDGLGHATGFIASTVWGEHRDNGRRHGLRAGQPGPAAAPRSSSLLPTVRNLNVALAERQKVIVGRRWPAAVIAD